MPIKLKARKLVTVFNNITRHTFDWKKAYQAETGVQTQLIYTNSRH
jgi:hypothetical protein